MNIHQVLIFYQAYIFLTYLLLSDKLQVFNCPITGDSAAVLLELKRSSHDLLGSCLYGLEPHLMFVEAWDALRKTMVYFRGQPVGTIAALDNNSDEKHSNCSEVAAVGCWCWSFS
ncbi:putative beta-fructofuranosidase [Helianthus annuus]|nr:putative beta-fructofuranosidase [Helianthus annuus]